MSDKRPRDDIAYAELANARNGARSKPVDIPCPVCGPEREGEAAKRKVMRTWSIGGDRISLHCVRCGVEGWVAPDGFTPRPSGTHSPEEHVDDSDEERERQRKLEAAARIWREALHIEGTPGALYFYKRGIDLTLLPDFGGLRWHPKCPWQGGPTGCVIARFTDAVTAEPRGIWRRPIKKGEKPRSLGPMAGCVIRLWPDAEVSTGLVLGEGIETTLAAALHITHHGTLLQPAWAAGNAGSMADLPVLPGIEALTLLVDNDANGAGQRAAAECARRWIAAGREVVRLTPKIVGYDFNDIVKGTAT
jgi:hypothetical protein